MKKLNKKTRIKLTKMQLANTLLFIFLLGAVISPFAGSCSDEGLKVLARSNNPLSESESIKGAEVIQSALREIYKEANPAVVRIETEQTVELRSHPFMDDPMFRHFFNIPDQKRKQKRQGLGSGFVITDDGYIVTNQHVVNNVDKITIKFSNGKEMSAEIIGGDSISDIALLKVDPKEKLKVVYIGDSDKIEVGDISIAIGNPFGLSSTFTMGVISSKGQDVNTQDGVPRIQTDAAINPGNSGGPLLNIRGEVIGINQMIYSQSGGSVGIGFAIPINYAMTILDKLKKGEKIQPAQIGVQITDSPREDDMENLGFGKSKGLLVINVVINSPAYKAGIRQYDLITHVDGKKAVKFSDLKSAVIRKGVGKKIRLTVLRNIGGKSVKKNIDIVIGEAARK